MKPIYLDYAATTPLDPEVKKFIQPYFDKTFGNSQSLHSFGQESFKVVEQARKFISSMLGCKQEEIIFTSGGTESNNTAIKGVYFANRFRGGKHIIISTIEHHAVSEPTKFLQEQFKNEGCKMSYVPVDKDGIVDVKQLLSLVQKDTILISIMHANNEIGTIQPIEKISELLKKVNEQRTTRNEPRIYFHTDAVQTFGHIEVNVEKLGVDLLSASAHKFYGPKGVGFLYVRSGTRIEPLLHGGGHEFGKRSSTLNISGIAGMYKSAEIAKNVMEQESKKIKQLRDKLLNNILDKIPDVVINGGLEHRLENNLNLSFNGIESESLLIALDNEGVAVSSGSACSSGSTEPSHVLLAIGREQVLSRGSIRFTLGRFTTEPEIDYVIKILPGIVKRLREISPLYKK